MTMTTMQSLSCCRGRMVRHPHETFYSSSEPSKTVTTDGSLPEGSLHLSNGVIHKENSEAYRTLTPENGCIDNFIGETYLLLC